MTKKELIEEIEFCKKRIASNQETLEKLEEEYAFVENKPRTFNVSLKFSIVTNYRDDDVYDHVRRLFTNMVRLDNNHPFRFLHVEEIK